MASSVGRLPRRAFRPRRVAGWAIGVGLVVGLLTALSLLLGLRKALQGFVHDVVVRVLVDVGLISQADKPRDQWPNGSTSLPVFLRSMWQAQEYMAANMTELLKLGREKDDE